MLAKTVRMLSVPTTVWLDVGLVSEEHQTD